MKKLLVILTLLGAALLINGCDSGSGGKTTSNLNDLIDQNPPDSPTNPTNPSLTQIALMASKLSVKTNGTDSSQLTVIASDANNAAIEGVEIFLKATAGLLSDSKVITAADGTASFAFSAGSEKQNQVVTITAFSGSLEKSIPISIVGTTLSLDANPTSVKKDVANGITLTGQALDANGNPVFNANFTLSSSNGNTLVGINSSGKNVSGTSITVASNINGEYQAQFTGNNIGSDTIILDGLGVKKQVAVTVTNASFGFTSPADGRAVPVGGAVPLVVVWVDDQGSPVVGKNLTFVASHGSFEGSNSSTTVAATDSTGQATVTYQADNFATPASVVVMENPADPNALQDTLSLTILAINPNRLDLQASPTVLPPSIGDVKYTSTITAVVRDESNNLVQGQLVTFKMLDGPGSGESIWPLVAVTDAFGQAKTTFTSGGTSSGQYEVKIQAIVDSASGSFMDEVPLTVGQEAARIVLGTTNKIEIIVKDGIEVGYGLPITALVTDNNGNPIPFQKVSLGIYPLRFKTGYWVVPVEAPALSHPVITGVFANEDVNRNGILDEDEDGAIGYHDGFGAAYYLDIDSYLSGIAPLPPLGNDYPGLNHILDPGNVGSIPPEVVTDENGLASFKIVYAKSYGVWVDMEITASTKVSGSETMATIERTLPWAYKPDGTPELPVINSPFGL